MKFKKLIAVVLCFTLIFCSMTVVSNASLTSSITATFETRKNFGNKITNIIQGVLKGFNSIYPKPMTWKSIDTFDGTYVYDEADGRSEYLTEPKDGANWNVGYASGSIIPDDFAKNKYYMGRQLNVVASAAIAKADGILDDQRVRVICINDNDDGKGAVVMAVIDGLGVTSGTIRAIREGLKEYTEDGRIASINISATHTHSALDTQGVSTSMLYVLFANTFTNILGLDRAKTSNDKFIETIKSVTVAKVKEAYDNMESGKLYYDTADGSEYIYDKREYITQDNIPPIGVIRFQPDNEESKGTYFVNMTCHPTNVSAKAGLVSADYPFYMDYTFQKNGYNFIMTQGAVGMVSGLGGKVEDDPNYTTAVAELGLVEKLGADKVIDTSVLEADAFAEKITEIILASGEDGEEELKPVINNKYTYTQFTTTNYTLHLACRCRLVDNPVYTTGHKLDDVVLPSEIGYLELGSRVAFGLFPCEFYPEVFHGQDIITEDVENYSWDGSEWTVPSAHNMVKDGIDIHAICFANDYIGYVVPDNYYSGWGHWSLKGTDKAYFEYDPDASIFDYAFRGTADELLSAGKTIASQIMNGFNGLVDSLESKGGNQMIYDKITNLDKYFSFLPEFKAMADFIEKNDLKTIAAGGYEICDGVKVSISDYEPGKGGDYECHRDYYDLQYAITGGETIKVVPTDNGKNFTEYKPDIQFFSDFDGNETVVALDEGTFAFLAPQDAHKPCVKSDCDTIRKAVFKIKIK